MNFTFDTVLAKSSENYPFSLKLYTVLDGMLTDV